jgi:hypothetical protein
MPGQVVRPDGSTMNAPVLAQVQGLGLRN